MQGIYVVFCQLEVISLIHLDLNFSTVHVHPDNNRHIQVSVLILLKVLHVF